MIDRSMIECDLFISDGLHIVLASARLWQDMCWLGLQGPILIQKIGKLSSGYAQFSVSFTLTKVDLESISDPKRKSTAIIIIIMFAPWQEFFTQNLKQDGI